MFTLDELRVSAITTPKVEDFDTYFYTGKSYYHAQGIRGLGEVWGVMDTGVAQHPELGNRLLTEYGAAFYNGKRESSIPDDGHGHGTHVAGTIGASSFGIAPEIEILPIRVLDFLGSGTTMDIVLGLEFALQWRHPRTGQKLTGINMSLSCSESYAKSDPVLFERYHTAIKNLVDAGIMVVVAAGNTGDERMLYPAGFGEVITVGAVDIDKSMAYFSTKSNEVDLAQVGVGIVSLAPGGGYAMMSGTSMAAPMVSGIAALLACKDRKVNTPDDAGRERYLYRALRANTVDISVPGIDISSGAGFCCLNPYPVKMEMTIGDKRVIANGKDIPIDVPMQLINNRTMVPIRAPFEAIGSIVRWDNNLQKATIYV